MSDERRLRLFVGVFPPASVQRDLHATLELAPVGPRLRWTAPEKMHLTLAFLGDVEPARLGEVRTAVEVAAGEVPSFPVELNGLGAFPRIEGPRVLFIGLTRGADRLEALARAQREALPADLRPDARKGFHPHLTIARPKRPPRGEEMRALQSELAPWRWRFEATELALVESVLDPAGARYTARHVTALRGRSG